MVKLGDIEDAFHFVTSAPEGENLAWVNRVTGQVVWRSELGEFGDEEEDIDVNRADWVGVPHGNELDLGRDLVFGFTASRLPGDLGRVEQIFSSRGAYGRFKAFLDEKGLLPEWYEYEARREREALREWCADEGIELAPEEPS